MKTLADRQTVEELLERIGRLELRAKARWGRMTAPQMICHLNDSYLGVMGLRPISPAENWVSRNLLRWMALRLPLRWPTGVPTRPEVDQEKFGTRPGDFARDVAKLKELLERFAAPPGRRDYEPDRHPGFGAMSDWEWMRWGYLHADHHLRQFGV